jgi:hypothetical protein
VPLLLQVLAFVVTLFLPLLLVQCRQQQLSLLVLFHLRYSRVRVVVGPFDCQHFTAV